MFPVGFSCLRWEKLRIDQIRAFSGSQTFPFSIAICKYATVILTPPNVNKRWFSMAVANQWNHVLSPLPLPWGVLVVRKYCQTFPFSIAFCNGMPLYSELLSTATNEQNTFSMAVANQWNHVFVYNFAVIRSFWSVNTVKRFLFQLPLQWGTTLLTPPVQTSRNEFSMAIAIG